MKTLTTVIILLFFSFYSYSQDKDHLRPKQSKITKTQYEESLDIFSSNEKLDSEVLEKSLGTVQMYLMQQNDKEGLLNMYDVVADYAKRTNQIKEYVDMRANKAQMLLSNGRAEESIIIIDEFLSNYEIKDNMKMRCIKARGDAYRDLDKFDECKANYNESLDMAIAASDTFYIGMCLISLAAVDQIDGNIYDAIDLNIQAMNILDSKKKGTAYLMVGAANVLTSIFSELENHEKALEYATVMHKLSTDKGYSKMLAYSQAALGRQAKVRKQYDKAVEYYLLALEHFKSKKINLHGNDPRVMIFRLNTSLAKVYYEMGKYDKVNELIRQNINEQSADLNNVSLIDFSRLRLDMALKTKKIAEAKAVIKQAEEYIDDNSSHESLRKMARMKAKVAESEGDFESANNYNFEFFSLKDSIESKNKRQLVLNLEAKYQKAEKEAEISKLSIENQVVESKLKKKNIWLILGGLGLSILSFLLFQVYKLNEKNKENKEILANQNQIITSALNDKNTLLKEIHHRVKNNLQVISSLLSLQSRFVKDEGTLDAINAGKSRVQSMSLLHQNLYRDDNLKGVDMKQYFDNLGQNLFDTYNVQDNIKFTTEVEDLTLDIDTVVPIGLITNELISNSLKHAFKGRTEGHIQLKLSEKNDRLVLTVSDNGIGLPDAELPVSSTSLGATLVQSFADKLEGDIIIDNKNGSSVTIEIKDYHRVE